MAEEWDEQGLGSLFVDGGTPEPEYAIQCLTVDRQQLSHEGATTVGFTPLVDRFDHPEKSAGRERATLLRLEPLRVYFREKRHSLWGHKLWNAARYLVKRIDSHMIDVRGKRVLELGAGLGVPSLAAFRNGARCVVVTDYNDKELLDIIQMNVNANCKPEMVDDDAVAFLLERMEHLRAMQMIPKQAVEKGKDGAINTQCIVQPLLWGNAEHIREALQRTGGAGFDVLLLSDILFNHVCNDDLADTVAQLLQRSQHAAAYCAFSHHRAHKQVEDLQFFDKCNSRGLACEQIDEEDYPLMFPDDNGPVEIRQPVKVYKITHRFDEAGPPLEIGQDQYDVAIQGAGVVECIVAAALARSGFRVLQCDAQSEYGGPFKTLSVERLRVYLEAQSAGEHSEGAVVRRL
ncbi:putative Lysine methyltransferase GDP dissociation inhibitor [Trypanosoma vivax]|nr:putative Lysine methyltransferase GDP dissociation inhibitor [Trypanosoma vivax]